MNPRLKQLVSLFPHYHIDGLLVKEDVNIKYLTLFPASESWLLVTPQQSFYITDFRYLEEARRGLKGVKAVYYKDSISTALFNLAQKLKIKKLGFDASHVTLSQYKLLKKKCPRGMQLVEANSLVEELREVKDRKELACIKEALKIHREALIMLKGAIKPGVKERDILKKLEEFIKRKKVGFSFEPIIASGPNSCYPHAKVTGRKVRNHEPVLVDMGIDVKGYKSDLTRMFFLGKIHPSVRFVNDAVKEAQQKAIEKIKAGVAVAELDKVARNSLAKKRLDKFFGHALGHGVGLEIHEGPRLSVKSNAVLKEGMVITIEPAVYLPNKFGIRLEEMVLVKRERAVVLSEHIH